MTAKLLALLVSLATLIPRHATVGGVCVQIHAAVLIVLLCACAGLGLAAWRVVRSFRSCPWPRTPGWSHA